MRILDSYLHMPPTSPRLRKATKTSPLYPLGAFPPAFVHKLAGAICSHIAAQGDSLEGQQWEALFAHCIGAEWAPSNIGLDDVRHGASSTAWGAKTVKGVVRSQAELQSRAPTRPEYVRLISGRNAPVYSFENSVNPKRDDPAQVGQMVVDIWNARVREVRALYSNLRTVVLVKDWRPKVLRAAVFETDTVLYDPTEFAWEWNSKRNLEGRDGARNHKFTWQPHGSQFTIKETIPSNALRLEIQRPSRIDINAILKGLGFDRSWYNRI